MARILSMLDYFVEEREKEKRRIEIMWEVKTESEG